ncbi:MAG: phosphatase PAP2 family protein [Thermoleophilia bacterium]|nr:phosphatase PAP2 family protein [Thermoleophilia bacterium]
MKDLDPRRIAHLERVHVPPPDAPLVGWRPLIVQVLLFVGAAVSYFAVRNLTEGSEATADANAGHIVSFERWLGVEWETALQGLIVDHDLLVDLANWIYIYGHWPLIGITLVGLFLRAPAEYRILRNAMFISGGIGLVIFAMYPVAPPRFGALDVFDTVTNRSDSYRTLQPPGLINRYAAMPSLHFGWNLLVGIVIWRVASSRLLKAFAVVIPVAMAFAVVVTGNHYVADVVAGGAVALVGLACAMVIASAPATAPSDRVGT